MGDEENAMAVVGALDAHVPLVQDACEETMLLWGLEQPTLAAPNSLVCQASLLLKLDACGQSLRIEQAPASMSKPGVTGAVMWDSGVVLAKFLEHAVDSGLFKLHGKKCVELGAGCGLVGCVAALLGARVTLTDLHDRLRLLQKNVEENVKSSRGSASVELLEWGADVPVDMVQPGPDFVLASDVVYNEDVVIDLLYTLRALCRVDTTVFLAGELRNDVVLECFFEHALKDFLIGRVPKNLWHPEFTSSRVAVYVMTRRPS